MGVCVVGFRGEGGGGSARDASPRSFSWALNKKPEARGVEKAPKSPSQNALARPGCRADREIQHIFSTAVLELGANRVGVGISEGTAVIQRVEGHSFSFLWAVAAAAGNRWAARWPRV